MDRLRHLDFRDVLRILTVHLFKNIEKSYVELNIYLLYNGWTNKQTKK